MKRAATFLVAVLTATTLAACSDNGSDSSGDASATSSASSSPTAKSSAAPAEPNAALACGRYFNGGEGSLNARVAAAVPVLEAQDAGTALDEDQTKKSRRQRSPRRWPTRSRCPLRSWPPPTRRSRTGCRARFDAAEAGGANAATLDYPTVSATIASACTAAGFPVS